MPKHWTESLFAEKFAELYITTLEEIIPRSIEDADGLKKFSMSTMSPITGLSSTSHAASADTAQP